MNPIWIICLWATVAFATIMVLLLSEKPARAQALCAPLPDLLASLQRNFNEFPVFRAEAAEGQRFIVTQADDGSWSAVAVNEDIGCLIAAGEKSEWDKGV